VSHQRVKMFQRLCPWNTGTSLHFDAALFPWRYYWILLLRKVQDMNHKLIRQYCCEQKDSMEEITVVEMIYTLTQEVPSLKLGQGIGQPVWGLWCSYTLHDIGLVPHLSLWLHPSKSFHFVFYPSPNHQCQRITCDLFPVPRFEVHYSMSWMMIDCTMW
jgi:hypothetical protein